MAAHYELASEVLTVSLHINDGDHRGQTLHRLTYS